MERTDREVIILPSFNKSLVEICDYIAQDSIKHSDKFVTDLVKVMDKIE